VRDLMAELRQETFEMGVQMCVGYLNRKRDAPPGDMVLWRGMVRLTDIHLGYWLARDLGN